MFLKDMPVKRETTITNKRAWIVSQFVEEINQERFKTKYKPVSPRSIAIKLSHLSEFDMSYFLSECRDYKRRKGSFSKCFYGCLKIK